MAPIICRVVDSSGVGIENMTVSLQCFISGEVDEQYFNRTGEDGYIHTWSAAKGSEPIVVDALHYTDYGITFRTESYFGPCRLPWRDVHLDLYLSGKAQHKITLLFGPENLFFQVTHNSEPTYHSFVQEDEVDWAGRPVLDEDIAAGKSMASDEEGEMSAGKRKASVGERKIRPIKKVRFNRGGR